MLSADSTALAGVTTGLTTGLTAVGTEIEQLFTQSVFNGYVPGIVETRTTGDDTREVSPTFREAMSISVDANTSFQPSAGDLAILAALTTPAQRFSYISGLSQFGGATSDELALRAIDINNDGQASVEEAFKVFFVGRLQNYLANNDITDQNSADGVTIVDLGLQVATFLESSPDAGLLNPTTFGVPNWLRDRVDLDIDDVTSSVKNGVLSWDADFSISVIQQDRFDLGYEADKLGIILDPGIPPNPNPNPFKVPVVSTIDIGSLIFGFTGAGDGTVVNSDFFFAAPDKASDATDGVRIGLSVGAPGSPYAVPVIGVNVGFLGAHTQNPSSVMLDMDVVGKAVDPSNVDAIGFTAAQQGVAQPSGTIEATNLVDFTKVAASAINFSLKIGNDPLHFETELTLPSSSYADTAAVITALNTAIGGSALSGLVSASDGDADSRISFTLVDSNPSQLGFANEQLAAGQITAGSYSSLIGVGKSATQIKFLLSVNNVWKLVTVNVTVDADGADNATGDAAKDADNNAITIDSLVTNLQAGLTAAFGAGVTAAKTGAAGNERLRISGAGNIEISETLTLDTVERITLAELQAASQVFQVAADPNAKFQVDLKLQADSGLEKPDNTAYQPTGTIKVDINPFTQVQGFQVDTIPGTAIPVIRANYLLTDTDGDSLKGGSSDMQTMLDFNVINVADILGAINEIGTWFERLSASDLLQGFDLPFGDVNLGNLLNLKDLIIDTFLIDDRDDGATKNGALEDIPKLLEYVGDLNKEKLVALFGNAQQLETRLNNLLSPLNVDGTVFTDGQNRQNLTYTVSFGGAFDINPNVAGTQPIVVPLDFELNLDPIANFETSGKLTIEGTGNISFTLGIILGNAVPALTNSTLLTDLNSKTGVKLNTNLALTTIGSPTPLIGRLSNEASFDVTVFRGAVADPVQTITISKSASGDNTSLINLRDDINASLAAKGLGAILEAVIDPVQSPTVSATIAIQLKSTADAAITRFQIEVPSDNPAFTELGLRSQSASTVQLVSPELIPAPNPGVTVSFDLVVRRGNTPPSNYTITIPNTDTSDNVALQSLINDINAKLSAANTGIVASQSNGRLVLSAIEKSIDAFSVTDAPALGLKLSTYQAALQGMGVATVPGQIIAGVQQRGGAAPADAFGRLAADASFTINTTAVDITAASTAANQSTNDLVKRINEKIETIAALKGKVAAINDNGRISFRAISVDPSVHTLTIGSVSASESTALGFADGANAGPLAIRPVSDAPVSYGVSSDVAFTVTINGTNYPATLTRDNTILNRSLFDLAASLNNSLNAALGGATKNPLIATVQSGQIVIGLKTGDITTNLIGDASTTTAAGGIKPSDVTSFSINSADAKFASEMKLITAANSANTADLADFIIFFRDGTSARITLDSLDGGGVDASQDQKLDGTMGALITQIESGIAAKLDVTFNSDGTSLRLEDKTAGSNLFRVVGINGSPAAAQLGILGSDTSSLNVGEVPAGAPVADGFIEGGKIATIDLRDRIYLKDAGATAELTVKTKGTVEAEASFGFAGIKLTSVSADQQLFKGTLNLPLINSEITLRKMFTDLGSPADLLALVGDPTLTLAGDFSFKVSTFPPLDLIGLGANPTVKFKTNNLVINLADQLPDPGELFPDFGNLLEFTDLGNLLKFDDIKFENVLAAMQAIAKFLKQFETFDFLDADIPVLGVSVNELIDLADQFQKAINNFQNNPAGGIQTLGQKILESLGLPNFADTAARDAFFSGIGINPATLPAGLKQLIQFSIDGNILRFDLRLPVGFNKSLKVDLDLGNVLPQLPDAVDIQGAANLAASGYLDARLSFGINLDNPTQLLIYDEGAGATGIFAGLKAGAQNAQFNAAIGPIGAFVKDGSVSVALDGQVFIQGTTAGPEIIDLTNASSLTAFLNTLDASLTGSANATLPTYFPTDSEYLGDIAFSAGFALSASDGLSLTAPSLTVPDLSNIDLSSLNPFNSIPQMLDALDFLLQGLQDIMDGEVFGVELPLIGDELQGAANFIEDLRRDVLGPIRQFVEQAPELGKELVQKLLYSLLGPGSTGVMFNGVALHTFLGLGSPISGLDLLKDYTTGSTADADITPDDIVASNDGVQNFQWLFRLGQSYKPTVDIDFDLGIPALALDMDVELDITIEWDLALGLGIGTTDGAYIYVGNHRGAGTGDDNELMLKVTVDVDNSSTILGTLGFLQLEINESNTSDPKLEHSGAGTPPRNTFVAAEFGVNLKNGSNASDQRLSFSELGSLDAEVSLSAEAEVNLDLTARFNPAIIPDAVQALLPEVKARFVLDWETGNIFGDAFDFASSLKLLGFRDVNIDMGSFVNDFLKPFVDKIAEVTEPLQPIIDVITAPIPVISDLAGQPISLVDIAGMTGYVEPAMIYAIADIISLVNKIAGGSYDAFLVPLGDFILLDTEGTSKVTGSTLMSPSYKVAKDPQFDKDQLKNIALDFDTQLNAGSGDTTTKSLVSGLKSGTEGGSSGFAFPLFDDPGLIFGLLLGKDIPIVTYDLAPFGMEFSYTQKFPVWDALFVRIGGSVGLKIDLAFGYDTFGIRQFADGGFSNPLDLLGGLYVSDTDQPSGEGTDVPELILKGELFAGAELNLGIASAGAEGAIGLVVNFDLYDPDSDGKVRVDELLGNFLYELNYGTPLLAPIAIFDVSGQVYAQLRAFVEALFFKYTFEITPPITLVEFEIPFEREPFLATERGDGSLLLNIGPNAAQRLNGDTRDIGETIYVRSLSNTEVEVWNGTTVKESDAQRYKVDGAKGIFGYGGQGDDFIDLSQVTHNIVYTLEGGVGDDTIKGTQFGGSMKGDLGNDKLTGGSAVDFIYGGDGNDNIDGGAGNDFIFGDTGTWRAISDEDHDPDADANTTETPYGDRLRAFVGDNDGDDTIKGGAGNDVILGGGGKDWIEGGADNDIILGDGGNFDRQGTNLLRIAGRFDVNARGAGDKDTIFGNGGTDYLFGGASDDLIDGGADNDEIEGGSGFDTIYGGSAADTIYGGADGDIIFGFRDPQGAFFGQAGETTDAAADGIDKIYGEEGNDFIRGNGANDELYGGAGSDIMFGDAGDDKLYGEAGGDIMFGGADNDTLDGSDGADIMFGDDGLVVWFDFSTTNAAFDVIGSRIRYVDGNGNGKVDQLIGDSDKTLRDAYAASADALATSQDLIVTKSIASDGSDTVIGGEGNDIMFGGGGTLDKMFGDYNPATPPAGPRPSGQDIIIGDGGRVELDGRRNERAAAESGTNDGNDEISGNDGSDYIFGGGFADTIQGFQTGAATPLANVPDNDIILGDNGEIKFDISDAKNRVKSVNTTAVAGDSGRSDVIDGDFGNDVIFGGLNSSNDVLNGDVGDDIIIGDQGEIRFDLDSNLDTLDKIESYRDSLGGEDIISGNQGRDILIGGTAGDTMSGNDGDDIMLGDNARIDLIGTVGQLTIQVAAMPTPSAIDYITTTDSVGDPATTGGADTMSGNAGSDIVIGGVFGDTLYGDSATPADALDGKDVLLGDNGDLDFTRDLQVDLVTLTTDNRNTLDRIRTFLDGLGGADTISGNADADTVMGGTAGDTIYGDNATGGAGNLDKADILLGDNGEMLFVNPALDPNPPATTDRIVILGGAVGSIVTTDVDNTKGGVDTISGNAGGDIALGGVFGDTIYGDLAAVTGTTNTNDGKDILLGDNGALEWLSTGRLGQITGINVSAENPELAAHFVNDTRDTNLDTLDLITTEKPTLGGRDTIYGDNASDVILGGTDADTLYGDSGDADAITSAAGHDLMFGDHGRLYPQFNKASASNTVNIRNFFAIDVGNTSGGEGDRMWGNEGDDIMLGQQGDDRMWGGLGDDDMIGGHNVSGGYDELTAPAIVAKLGTLDVNDLMDGGGGDDAMTGDNAIVWRRNDDNSPRFQTLAAGATSIYTTTPTTITTNIGGTPQSDPDDAVGRDIQLVDHSDAVQATPLGRFGDDVMAGGADSDVMFGELGNDLMQGDGNIGADDLNASSITRSLVVTDSVPPPPPGGTGETLYFNVPEAASDGDDYLEGNGGSDLMYGGLGQDDLIGGSSALFGLTTEAMRPDVGDTIFGGAGVDVSRNNLGDATLDANQDIVANTVNHGRDADFIMGDNANVYRIVASAGDVFRTFNYDNYTTGPKIIPRGMQQLDYTLGGGDFAGSGAVRYNSDGQAMPTGLPVDNGGADLIHGESGDDIIFGMTGSDVLYGEGQDDDIIGGYGNDWISGGTGQDGVLGDDGLILTSRNSTTGEPLNNIAGLIANGSDPQPKYANGNVLDEVISTPGQIQTATVNVTGALKKTADVTMFSYDKDWVGVDDEYPDLKGKTPFADDIIFGGLGSDFLHGGSGDDAISGAEALQAAFVPTYNANGDATGVLDLGYDGPNKNLLVPANINPGDAAIPGKLILNPGDVLAYNPEDTDGQHTNNRFRAGEFRLYDEYDPRRKILLTPTGELFKGNSGVLGVDYFEFLLNFNETEGVIRPAGTVPKSTGQQAESYPQVNDDGTDAIFGDLGNDWIVGGTGRDNVYGGWGNDLLQVDDNLKTETAGVATLWDNESPDTHPTYEDRAYGGAGRDVLIGNTGGDRLIDWVGEYNSYLVPFAPFGQAAVSRTLQPFLPEFLYALSAGDGADPTRYRDAVSATPPPAPTNNNPNPSRNGEPFGELGLVLQKDFAWGDQTGAPADPQAGNIPGGPRDVLRSASFSGPQGQADGFAVDVGTWSVSGGRYEVAPSTSGGDALSVMYVDSYVPKYFEMMATINAEKPTGGNKSNAYLIFDYQSSNDFKFAGINVSTNKLEIGHKTAAGWIVDVQGVVTGGVKADTDYNMFLSVNGTAVTLIVNNQVTLSYNFAPRVDVYGLSHAINEGMVGLGASGAKATIDNVVVQRIPPVMTLNQTVDFASGPTNLFLPSSSGTWSTASGRYNGTATATTPAVSLLNLDIASNSLIDLSSTLQTSGSGGFVFDYYGTNDFKFVTVSADTKQILIGHRTAKGWFIDEVYNKADLAANVDYTLGLTLKGTTASVTLNGAVVASHIFNGVVTDGDFGLFSRSGLTSFDSMTVKTDDPNPTS